MADLIITPSNVINPRAGINERTAVAGETILAGQAIYLDASDHNKARLADADSLAPSRAKGIALASASAGQAIRYQTKGRITLGNVLIEGRIYVVSTNAGAIAPINDLGEMDYVTVLGVAVSSSQLDLAIEVTGTLKESSAPPPTYLETLLGFGSVVALYPFGDTAGPTLDNAAGTAAYDGIERGVIGYQAATLENGDQGIDGTTGGVDLAAGSVSSVYPHQLGALVITFAMSSIGAWTNGNDKVLYMKENGTNGFDSTETFWLYVDGAGDVNYMHRVRNNVYSGKFTPAAFDTSKHRIVINWDTSAGSGSANLFYDGANELNLAVLTDSAGDAPNPNRFGFGFLDYGSDPRYFPGYLWYAGLYSKNLSAGEIAIYGAPA